MNPAAILSWPALLRRLPLAAINHSHISSAGRMHAGVGASLRAGAGAACGALPHRPPAAATRDCCPSARAPRTIGNRRYPRLLREPHRRKGDMQRLHVSCTAIEQGEELLASNTEIASTSGRGTGGPANGYMQMALPRNSVAT